MKILLAFSGGLDTSFLVASLSRAGHQVVACTVDCGGFDVAAQQELERLGMALGAVEVRRIDARQRLYDQVLRWLIAGNVRRGGVYPLCVGAERGLQAAVLAEIALAEGFDALAHGCTAAGNDQVRFEAALSILAPDLLVLAPIREQPIARSEQVALLESMGMPVPGHGGTYSINAGLWGLTIGGGSILDSAQGLPEEAWQWTANGTQAMELVISYFQGNPVACDGVPMGPVELIEHLNLQAGACGVGRGYHTGDTVLGFKGRVAFEAPGAEVLLNSHRELEKLVLTEDQRFWKDHMGEVYGQQIHKGLSLAPLLGDLRAFFASSQSRVSGDVTLQLKPGSVLVTGVQSPHSLMLASDAVYGEVPAQGADADGPIAFARVHATPSRLYSRMS